MYFKNQSGQYVDFVMRGFDGEPETGLVGTLSGTANKDGGAYAAVTGAITEYGATGIYQYAMSQAETNGDVLHFLFTDSSGTGLSAFREVVTAVDGGGYLAADRTRDAQIAVETAAIKPKTDQLNFTGVDVRATLDSEEVDIGAVKGTGVTDINEFKADVSALALEGNVEGHAADALTNYPVSTRAQDIADRDQIISEVDANETKIDTLQTDVTAVKGKTDQLNFTGSDVKATLDGELVNLADDAITSDKYDETTAYPVKLDDSGDTQIARKGAGSHTLETISNQVAAIVDRDWGWVMADDNSDVELGIWLMEEGQRRTDLTNMSVVIRDYDGTEVYDLGTSTNQTAQGKFYFTFASSLLTVGKAYTLDVTATKSGDPESPWSVNLGFERVL